MRQTRQNRHLTPRQQRFVEEYIITGNASEAYRIAYNAGRWTAHAVNNEANALKKHPGVSLAIARLRRATESEAIASVVERKERLTEVLRKPLPAAVPVRDIIAASDQLNRMESVYVDRSMSLNANVDLTELEGFSLEELKALLGKMAAQESAP